MYACIHMPFISQLGWHPSVLSGLFLCDVSGIAFSVDCPLAVRALLWVYGLLGSCPYLPWVDCEHKIMMKENNGLLFSETSSGEIFQACRLLHKKQISSLMKRKHAGALCSLVSGGSLPVIGHMLLSVKARLQLGFRQVQLGVFPIDGSLHSMFQRNGVTNSKLLFLYIYWQSNV